MCISTKAGSRPTDNYVLRNIPNAEILANINPSGNGMNGQVFLDSCVSPTLTTNKGEGIKIAGHLDMKGADQLKRIYETGGGKPHFNHHARRPSGAEDTPKDDP